MQIQSRRKLMNNTLLLSLLLLVRKKRKEPKRFWVRDIFENRKGQDAYHNLLQEMRLSDCNKYFNYLRMSSETFHKLLQLVGPKLTKMYCVREPICASERLAVTLRYLASGDSMASVSYAFRIAPCTVSNIILETSNVLWDCLHEIVLLKPAQKSWLKIAQDFETRWQLPDCVGAIDGKHIVIQVPPKSGSTYYNYKGTHSVVLLALCDANYRFTLVDIGAEGSHSDGDIPPPSRLRNTGEEINYYIAADEAFPLSTCIMRPYAGRFLSQTKRIFNYRLCRGRRVIENVFGILAARWRIFRKPIIACDQTVLAAVKATVCLHNYLMKAENEYFSTADVDHENNNGDIIEGDWRRNNDTINILPVKRTSTNMYGRSAENMKGKLATYFTNEGAV